MATPSRTNQPHPVYGLTIALTRPASLAERSVAGRGCVTGIEAMWLRPGGGYYEEPRFWRSMSPSELRAWLRGDEDLLVAYTQRWTRKAVA
jgi:hypothetical protein